jgi:hypothetical protein
VGPRRRLAASTAVRRIATTLGSSRCVMARSLFKRRQVLKRRTVPADWSCPGRRARPQRRDLHVDVCWAASQTASGCMPCSNGSPAGSSAWCAAGRPRRRRKAGWPAPRLERLHDVEWARVLSMSPTERMLGTTPQYIVAAG